MYDPYPIVESFGVLSNGFFVSFFELKLVIKFKLLSVLDLHGVNLILKFFGDV